MRVASKPSVQYPWYVRLLFWLQRRKHGEVLKPALLWGRSPRVFLAMASLYAAIDRKGSPLEPVLRSLVTVHVSQMNACRFCVDINSATLAQPTSTENSRGARARTRAAMRRASRREKSQVRAWHRFSAIAGLQSTPGTARLAGFVS